MAGGIQKILGWTFAHKGWLLNSMWLTTMRVLNLFLLFPYSQNNDFKEEEILPH
jgi:hypothetical protein